MTNRTGTRATGIFIAGTAAALILSACQEDVPQGYIPSHEPVTLTVAYWGDIGLTGDETGPSLVSQYEELKPWVTLEMDPGDFAHNLLTVHKRT